MDDSLPRSYLKPGEAMLACDPLHFFELKQFASEEALGQAIAGSETQWLQLVLVDFNLALPSYTLL